jgi:hypothetical protein
MCCFLCANSVVYQWLDEPVDEAVRKAIALKPLLAADLLECDCSVDEATVSVRVAAAAETRVRVGVRTELVMVSQTKPKTWRFSSQLRNEPFPLLARAWNRLLLWLRSCL